MTIDEIGKIKSEIDSRIQEIIKRIDEQLGKLSKLEEEARQATSPRELRAKLLEARQIFRQLRTDIASARVEIRAKLLEARRLISAGEPEAYDLLEDLGSYMEERLRELQEKLSELRERAREIQRTLRGRGGGRRLVVITSEEAPGGISRVIKMDFPKVFEAAFATAWRGGPTTVVSSVRLPEADLKLIDMLAELGIFRSRNEGIAFFTHKGIEASKEWLENIKAKLDEIKRLQEEARRELEKMGGEGRDN